MSQSTSKLTKSKTSRLSARLWAILAVVILADVLDLMDSTITNIAAPSIVHSIGGGESLIKWLGASYALAIGVLLVVGGRLGDRYGKRRLFLIGITGFTLASAVCGLSTSPAMIIIARLFQGGFGALLIPQGISILLATFSKEQLPIVFSVFGPTLGVSAVLGPIVAGFIISANIAGLHWRPVFLINIILGVIGFIAAYCVLPNDMPDSRERIDLPGSGLLGLTMLGLIFGLIEGSTDGWKTLPIASLFLGALSFTGFVARQRSAASPLIKPSLLSNRGFTSGLLMGLGFFASVSGLAYVVSLFFQLSLHFTPSHASVALAPLMVGIILASFASRPLIGKLGRSLVSIGLSATFIGAVGLWLTVLHYGLTTTAWLTAPSLLILGLGMGTCFFTIYELAIGDIAHNEAGSASGALSAVQQLANAVGSAIVTSVYFDVLAKHGDVRAMTVSVAVVAIIVLLCLPLVGLLPKKASANGEI
jgi:EmrB/QacA subfamily drug resistance transporter